MTRAKQKQENKEYILNKLSPEYVSIYRIELNSGNYEILRLSENTNAISIVGDDPHPFPDFDTYVQQYAQTFIFDEDKDEFLDWLSCRNMQTRLRKDDKITYHYKSVSREGVLRFYEAYAVKGYIDEEEFNIFLAFRNVDSILYKEKAIQEKLQIALEESELRNEIISSIAKTYQYISRIDIEADYYEEVGNKGEEYSESAKSGIVSTTNIETCRRTIAQEYQEAFLKFVDLKTLPERMKNEETIVMEYRMKDGDWHKLRFIEKKRDKDGKLTHVLCAVRSISDTKKREQELLYQVEEAKEDAALKTRFLSNMSHDIRTPINGIMGMVELANQHPEDLKLQQRCRDNVMASSKYLVSLVNDILDMNKLESGEIVDQEIAFNLTDLLNRANTDKQRQAEEKNIDYVVDWDRAEMQHVELVGNPIYLERLLSNVADNAVKFTKPGGTVHVWCTEKVIDEEQTLYSFYCSDNGIGMSEDFVGHAFDMFSQENETSRTNYEGSGLGLAIAKKLADRLGGTIEIESRKGSGTTVTMTVPLRIGKSENYVQEKSQKPRTIEGLCVLLAEDNELNMEIAKFMLEHNGIYVECATDGAEAVDRFENSTEGYYDAIFMDIKMPNLNGWDATRKIRSLNRQDASKIPIIAVSANAFAEDMINSRISGMNRHLMKPLSEEKLMSALQEVL